MYRIDVLHCLFKPVRPPIEIDLAIATRTYDAFEVLTVVDEHHLIGHLRLDLDPPAREELSSFVKGAVRCRLIRNEPWIDGKDSEDRVGHSDR